MHTFLRSAVNMVATSCSYWNGYESLYNHKLMPTSLATSSGSSPGGGYCSRITWHHVIQYMVHRLHVLLPLIQLVSPAIKVKDNMEQSIFDIKIADNYRVCIVGSCHGPQQMGNSQMPASLTIFVQALYIKYTTYYCLRSNIASSSMWLKSSKSWW